MIWKLKGKLFGVSYDFDIDTRLPLQEIYDIRLKLKLFNKKPMDFEQSKEFICYSLQHLPNGSFIIFEFDPSEGNFVQFRKTYGCIVLDIPFLLQNAYNTKEKDVMEILQSMHLKRTHTKKHLNTLKIDNFDIISFGEGKKSLNANFGYSYEKATEVALSIAVKLFGKENPSLNYYESARLIPVTTK